MTAALTHSPPEVVANVGALLGEGPLWDPRENALYWLDIKGETIFRHALDSGETNIIAAPGMVSAMALARSGGFICAYRNGFARLSIENGKAHFTPIIDPETDKPGNRFNDGKADPAGFFWAGTMDDAEKETSGAWWQLSADGAVTKVDDPYHVTNGPAFDPARGRVYLTDSARQTVFVAETDGTAIRNKKPFLQFGENDGYPDGMEVDAEGCLWIAFWDGFAVRRYSPDGGLLHEIAMPVPRPTSLAIIDDAMFITSASIGLPEEDRTSYPHSGGLFYVKLSRALADASSVRYVEDIKL
ncbi:SMP-30/gluconolactonase/LRE family protein [Hyphococcus sp.]|uniref:SMP-30/gluconolactonase/LRE family protein n=1 Tax=Hyphococcus sp. TaxID=2038636 RepID=UPI0035C731BC